MIRSKCSSSLTTTFPRSRWTPAPRQAFTLVEILVAGLILAVLAALLIMGAGSIRAQALQSGCLYKVRQVGTGLLACAAENGGRTYPFNPGDSGVWPRVVDDYLGGNATNATVDLPIWACQASHPTGYARLRGGTGIPGGRTSWAGNSTLGSAFATQENPAQTGVSGAYVQSQVRAPSRMVYVVERNMIDHATTGATFYNYNQYPPGMHQTNANARPFAFSGHKGGNSILFLDGHAEYATRDHPAYSQSISIRQKYWDPGVQ